MLSSLKVAKKHVHVCFHGKHFTCWDLRGMLETDSFAKKNSRELTILGQERRPRLHKTKTAITEITKNDLILNSTPENRL